MKKVILDLCGGTGAWAKPYREAGYDVHLITLPEYDICETQIFEDRLTFQQHDGKYQQGRMILCSDVYGILADPPCTEFSKAKGAAPRDFHQGMAVVEMCMKIIWACRKNGGAKFWAMENPVGFLRQFMGIPRYQFQQWQFGEMKVKETDVWGYFNPPTPTVKLRPEQVTTCIGKRTHSMQWNRAISPPEYKHMKLSRAAIRAITPPGFAQAFYKANK